MEKITQDNKSSAGWTENIEDKKIEGIDNVDKKKWQELIWCLSDIIAFIYIFLKYVGVCCKENNRVT